jgi:DNA-binding transcriptional regulator YiaG
MPETVTETERLGRALLGAGFSSRALAAELGREERTVRRWVTGDHAPPAEAITALRALMLQRADLIKKTAKA